MPFLIEATDKPDHAHVRQALRQAHRDYLQSQASRLLACGAKLQDDGSDGGGGVYIVDVDTRAEAEAFIQADPFWQGQLFADVRIVRWRKAYLAGQCCL